MRFAWKSARPMTGSMYSFRIFSIELFSGFGNSDFRMNIGGTVYEVSTHFDPEGSRCVLQQFRDLILSEDLLENRIIAENAKAQ